MSFPGAALPFAAPLGSPLTGQARRQAQRAAPTQMAAQQQQLGLLSQQLRNG